MPLTASITGTVTANIGTTGGLALESTLSALNAKFVPGNELGEIKVTNGPGAAAVNIQDGGNSITVDGSVSITNDPFVRLRDAAGTGITSTLVGPKQALDVYFAGGSISVNLDNATDDVLVYGWDGAANQKIKTDGNGELQVDILSSALPTGAATETTLFSIDTKIPVDPSREHITAISPHAARLTDGTSFYKATTPSDIQPVAISQAGTDNNVDATIINEPSVNLQDGAGTDITSSFIAGRQALDVHVVDTFSFVLDHSSSDVLIYGYDGTLNQKIKTNSLGQLETMVVGSVLPTGAATEFTLSAMNAKIPAFPATDRTAPSGPFSVQLSNGSVFLTTTAFAPAKTALDVNILGGIVTGSFTFVGDTEDLDTGAGTDEHAIVAIGLPASGGHVVGGTATDPLRVDPTGTTPQPVTLGTAGDYYRDDAIIAAAVGGIGTAYTFGFTAQNITILNDETTGGGAKDIEFSFDGFTTVHGILHKGEAISMDNRRRSSINLRSVGVTRAYRLIVWG